MKPIFTILGIVFLAQLIASENRTERYTITGANTIRENTKYHVAATHHGSDKSTGPMKIQIKIIKANDNDPLNPNPQPIPGTAVAPKVTPLQTELTVPSGKTMIASIKIPNWPQGQYVLTITGEIGDEKIDRRALLSLNTKTVSIFIQTDKSIYQEGQLVQFRTVVVDSELRPRPNTLVQVSITDPSNNIIKMTNHTTDPYGIIEDNFQLSTQPVFGTWSLSCTTLATDSSSTKEAAGTKLRRRRVPFRPRPRPRPRRSTAGGESASVNFEVKEYVLSKFSVQVTPPDYIVRSDKEFTVIVNATYTYNKGVPGSLLLNVTDMSCTYTYSQCKSKPVVIRISNFTGYYKTSIKMGDLALPKYVYSISIFASVTEKDTGITKNDTASATMYDTDITMNINQPSSLRPGIPHVVTINLVKQNGRPVISAGGQKVSASYSMGLGDYKLFTMKFNDKGTASFTVNALPDSTQLSVTAKYKDITTYGSASVAQSLSTKYLSLTTATPSPSVGKPIVFEVKSSVPYSGLLSYQVVGRGTILGANTIAVTISPTIAAEISIKATKDMSPHTKFVVFYVTSCGEIVGNALDVDVDGVLETLINLETSAGDKTVEPGDNITVTVKSSKNTNVALLGVDTSLLLMSTPNDILQSNVYNELNQYDIGDQPYYGGPFIPGFIRRPDWGTLDQIFSYAGLILFTDGLYSKGGFIRGPIYYNNFRSMGKASMMMEDAAAPMAGAGGGSMAPPRVREKFPETFIYTRVNTNGENGTADVTFTVPDTITTWYITAFGVNKKTGLGLLKTANNVTVFRPFFISLNLPYSVVQGETVNVQVMVFNYLDKDVTAKVSLAKSQGNEFESNDTDKKVQISKNNVATTSFRIKPLTAGKITIKITATTIPQIAADAVQQELLVKPEGTTVYRNDAKLIKVNETDDFSEVTKLIFPSNTVRGSGYAEVTVIGDMMKSVYDNIGYLIRLPSGCGEQNMVTFVPDVVLLDYYKKSGLLTSELESTLKSYLESGFQTEMNYKRYDGSYSAFGNSDNDGSTWLTAFVVKSFEYAKQFIRIDDTVINPSKDFLARTQIPTGEFVEKGRILSKAMQGGSGKGFALTAFVLIAFLETPDQDNSQYITNINLAVKLLEKNLDSINSVYELSIITYALHLANSPLKDKAFEKLDAQKQSQSGLEFWHYPLPMSDDTNVYDQPQTYDVETTSYALLVYHLRQLIDPSLPIVRWLVSQRSSLGGYASSQDTVIGIQAMGTVASLFTTRDIDMTVEVKYGNGKTLSYDLKNDNKIVVNTNQIPAVSGTVEITATGTGTGYVQVSWNYNVPQAKPKNPAFSVNTTVTRNTNGITLSACASFLRNDTTNMAIIEINTVSGQVIDRDTLPPYGSNQDLKRIDFSDGDTSAAFYYYSIGTIPYGRCIQVNTLTTSKVEGLKPAVVRAYDYYDPNKQGIAIYKA